MTATLVRLWAVASLTLKEAVRRKAFLLLILFAVALLSSMTFFSSVDPVSRLRLIEVWSLRATVFFAAIAAIFLGSASLPGDYEAKRIYVLASKPISKATFFFGKYLGFLLMLAIFMLIMGAITVAYIRIVKATGGPEVPELRARPLVPATGFEGIGVYEPAGPAIRVNGTASGTYVLTYDPASVAGWKEPVLHGRADVRSQITGATSGSIRVVVRLGGKLESADLHDVLVPIEHGTPFAVPIPASLVEPGRPVTIRLSPADCDLGVRLRELTLRDGTRGIAHSSYNVEGAVVDNEALGPAAGALRWTFTGFAPSRFPEAVSARVRLAIDGASMMRFTGKIRVIVENGARRLDREVFAQSNEYTTIEFPRAFLEAGPTLTITVLPTDSDIRLSSQVAGALFFEKSELFEWNFLKGLGLLFLWIALVLTISFCASVRLSTPVSMLFGVALLLVSSIHGFTKKGLEDIDRVLEKEEHDDGHGHARKPDELPPWLLEYSRAVTRPVLEVVPGSDTYDFQKFLLADLAVGGQDLRAAALNFLPRAAVLLLIGMVLLLRKDFAQ